MVVVTTGFGVVWPSTTLAANGNFILSPGKVEVTVAPGQVVTKQLSIVNNLGRDSTFVFSTEDFKGNDNASEGLVELLGDADGQNSLKHYISFKTDSINIPSGGEYVMDVKITIPSNTPAGALYGAVMVSAESDTTEANIQVNSRLAALFFVKVEGEVIEQGQLVNFQADKKLYTNSPIQLDFDYSNTGDVYLNPYGLVTVSNVFNHTVTQAEVAPYFVLPNTIRNSGVKLTGENMFGPYRVTMQLNRGYDNIIDEKGIWIWVLPWQGVVVAVLVLGALIYLIIIMFRRRPRPHKIFKTKPKK